MNHLGLLAADPSQRAEVVAAVRRVVDRLIAVDKAIADLARCKAIRVTIFHADVVERFDGLAAECDDSRQLTDSRILDVVRDVVANALAIDEDEVDYALDPTDAAFDKDLADDAAATEAECRAAQEKLAVDAYNGSSCPFCGCVDLDCGKTNFDGPEVSQEVRCESCNREWFDIYGLKGMEMKPAVDEGN